ncbi:MAG: RtcB family protein [Candidatus Omnitrophica bacterium]|nr:RtcB family protein [Candidatus Omnitrophota bacterium]
MPYRVWNAYRCFDDGGNHFIEIQKDDSDFIWIMIHSGSRNIGYKVAKFYNDKAKEISEKGHVR